MEQVLSSADKAALKYNELLMTEEAYVQDLRTMATVYARPAEKVLAAARPKPPRHRPRTRTAPATAYTRCVWARAPHARLRP